MKKEHIVIAAAVLFIALFVAATAIYNSQKDSAINSAAQDNASYMQRNYSPTLGSSVAKVTIVEFFDPACGTCSAFYPFVKRLMAANPRKVNLVLRYLPLHPGSDEVIKILEAARLQNLFWETLEATYKSQSAWVVRKSVV